MGSKKLPVIKQRKRIKRERKREMHVIYVISHVLQLMKDINPETQDTLPPQLVQVQRKPHLLKVKTKATGKITANMTLERTE